MIEKPLAYRMRPEVLDEVIGQERIKSFLKKLIESNSLLSMIFYGPPGTGKTTLARAFGKTYNINTISLNAVIDNKSKMEQAFEEAIRFSPSIVIIDEIHRMDKGKQDILLPHLENGDFYLIGCTTANPLISLNPAIRSRCRLLETESLNEDQIQQGLERAITSQKGLSGRKSFSPEAISHLARISGGDLRFAYNQLEAIALGYSSSHTITLEDAKEIANMPNYLSDKDEDEHYDTVSAFQKSIRGSEVDAAIYYLAKLLKSGDLEGTIRRLEVLAYEDIGLGNPAAVDRCYHACEVARNVGMPEAQIPLSFTVCDLALSPKSKSTTLAIEAAMECVDDKPIRVRDYLRFTRANVQDEDLYPYNEWSTLDYLEYLPEELVGTTFYQCDENRTGKYEMNLSEYWKAHEHKRYPSVREARIAASQNKKRK
jgi:putative ATPase